MQPVGQKKQGELPARSYREWIARDISDDREDILRNSAEEAGAKTWPDRALSGAGKNHFYLLGPQVRLNKAQADMAEAV
jgi:hypothetical protein